MLFSAVFYLTLIISFMFSFVLSRLEQRKRKSRIAGSILANFLLVVLYGTIMKDAKVLAHAFSLNVTVSAMILLVCFFLSAFIAMAIFKRAFEEFLPPMKPEEPKVLTEFERSMDNHFVIFKSEVLEKGRITPNHIMKESLALTAATTVFLEIVMVVLQLKDDKLPELSIVRPTAVFAISLVIHPIRLFAAKWYWDKKRTST